jgi:APA family basic amino acid/polyamine antiporter
MSERLMNVLRRKTVISPAESATALKRSLTAIDLTLLGVGATIGAGIFVLSGVVAATQAGPAIVLSFVLAGFACGCAAMSYAELASSIGGCGSAYGYAYASLGELPAWIIGWMLLCEYMVALPAVATGWSAYVASALQSIGVGLSPALIHGPFDPRSPGLVDLPAALIVIAMGVLLGFGAKISSPFNAIIVAVKVAAIALFIIIAVQHINVSNWTPFIPPQITEADGSHHFGVSGVVTGAASIFFAYLGFDAVATAAEETRDPSRDLPLGLMGSLLVCTLLYILVSGLLTGIAQYTELNVASPVAEGLVRIGKGWAAGLVSVGAIAGLTTAILAMYFAVSRVLYAISRDGLLPGLFSYVHPKTQTPLGSIVLAGIATTLFAGWVPLGRLAEIASIGTLGAFVVVCAGVLMLRVTQPDLHRPFRAPWSPLFPVLGMLSCGYLMSMLSRHTWVAFGTWMTLGLVVYGLYGYSNSRRPALSSSRLSPASKN